MALPGVSLPLLSILLVAVELLGAPSNAARAALLPEVFPDDRYVVASAVGNITGQCAQVLGFAADGALAALLGPSRTLLVDAATSPLLLAVGVRERPAPRSAAGRSAEETLSPLGSFPAGTHLVVGNRRLRALVALAWLCGFYVVPEGAGRPVRREPGRSGGDGGVVAGGAAGRRGPGRAGAGSAGDPGPPTSADGSDGRAVLPAAARVRGESGHGGDAGSLGVVPAAPVVGGKGRPADHHDPDR